MKYLDKINFKFIIAILVGVVIIILYCFYLHNTKDIIYTGTIEDIRNDVISVKGTLNEDYEPCLYEFTTKNVNILDSNGERINISDLNIGNVISITVKKRTIITASIPPRIDKVKQVQILKG